MLSNIVPPIEAQDYIRINEIKNMIYCPRIPFYTLCLHLDRETGLSRLGLAAEAETKKRMKRRQHALHAVVEGERHFDQTVFSRQYGIIGQIDEVVVVPEGVYLVDYKDTDKDYGYWKVQLAAYAYCVQDMLGQLPLGCYVYSIPTQTYHEVTYNKRQQRKLMSLLAYLRGMTQHEICPEPTPQRAKCNTCQYLRFCNDIE